MERLGRLSVGRGRGVDGRGTVRASILVKGSVEKEY